VTWLVCTQEFWIDLSGYYQVAALALISGISQALPSLFAYISYRRIPRLDDALLTDNAIKTIANQTAVSLPPAFVSGFDAVSLTLTGHSDQLALYGITSRLYIAVSLVPASVYVQLNNHFVKRNNQNLTALRRTAIFMFLLNLPFAAAFLIAYPWALRSLSASQLSPDRLLPISVAVVGLVLPVWITLSGASMSEPKIRDALGKKVLTRVLPVSVVLTLLASKIFGATGPFLASALTYLLASYFANRVLMSTAKWSRYAS
jgi:hypothetical protein